MNNPHIDDLQQVSNKCATNGLYLALVRYNPLGFSVCFTNTKSKGADRGFDYNVFRPCGFAYDLFVVRS